MSMFAHLHAPQIDFKAHKLHVHQSKNQFASSEFKFMKNQNGGLANIRVKPDSYECTITTDIAVFGYLDGKLKILLTKRSLANYKSHWLLPGGTMDADETVEECAKKTLFVLTGLENIRCEYIKLYSALNRHPIKRVVTASFCALIQPEKHPLVLTDNVESLEWFSMDDLPTHIAFDHTHLINDAYNFLKENLEDKLHFGELLPKQFTLSELQVLYETIFEVKVDKRNFRKRIMQINLITNTRKKKRGVKGGPFLFEYKRPH